MWLCVRRGPLRMKDSFDAFYDEVERRLREEGRIVTEDKHNVQVDNTCNIQNMDHSKFFVRTYSLADVRASRIVNKIILESVCMQRVENFLLKSFADVRLSLCIYNKLREMNINQPTPIQMQMIPLVLGGYNVFGQSMTGTGKTLCFALPLIMMKLEANHSFNGAIILVPTRELCLQIKAFLEHFVSVKSAFGGTVHKTEKARCNVGMSGEIYVATPGKLLQLLEKNNFARECSHLILDEADKMTSPEFVRNIKTIVEKMKRPQFCVLAATCFDSYRLKSFIRIDVNVFIGNKNAANEYVTQIIKLVDDKFAFLKEIVGQNVLIFVNSKDRADELTLKLRNFFKTECRTGSNDTSPYSWKMSAKVESLHAGKEQIDRNKIIEQFNSGSIEILICTSLLSRGIDFKVDCVINYDCPHTIDDYIHRIGRTGRMRYGTPRHGVAYTLLEKTDKTNVLCLYKFWIDSNVRLDENILNLLNE
ncbi:RNA helicase [Trachipleistophora hominis]|uniref:RNA helicase n=1 Tax=Trachipleistophora hominis TaxID=72359 RepID=L7K057_TRAHO|nr:RNA helicase [Trachipleistophora hominis]